ncbi:TetR/AcrR family transcriptional regulator [Geomonas oryzisoli]|uniref:TetR/AcrR family transcriptional regulator n=1 Tax=Geomonas oryzisoli TaxID=2847992 RepID=A0ABX8J620_9BACT|nr:TetR/AcrR family transcriptional regulator [Geomonas oryzisoli]QWV93880.1 TetR/AcrR family transcriptional regulator [Geomonas oryzisoli]
MRISEQAKQLCRARILEKAAELFAARGFDQTTTRDIALAVGVAAGTMFNYFPSKETMAMTMVNEALAQGREEFLTRLDGGESLEEELFLLIGTELRRLRPLRPFLGPVLERSLSPFPRKSVCPEGETARQEHLECVRQIMLRHGFVTTPEDVAGTIYWSLYLGILASWTGDQSDNQESSRALIDYAIRTFVQMISGAHRGGDHVR